MRTAVTGATRVREARAGERVDVRGLNIGTVLDASGFEVIDILKVDIENARRSCVRCEFRALAAPGEEYRY